MAVRSPLDRSSCLLEFLRTEEASGVFLLGATAVALIWANSALRESYEQLWSTFATIQLGGLSVGMDLQHWVNEGLMTLFFLVVGLEIKRDVTTGELRNPRTLALPIIASPLASVIGAIILRSASRFSRTDISEVQPVGRG